MVAGRHNLTRRALLGAGVGLCAAPAAAGRAQGGGSLKFPGLAELVEAPFCLSSSSAQEKEGPSTSSGKPGGGGEAAALRRRWTRALAAYHRAEARVAAFKTAESALPPERRAYPACEDLEAEYGRLDSLRTRALARLLALPAPDLPALALKLELAVGDLAWELAACESCLTTAAADARRLSDTRRA